MPSLNDLKIKLFMDGAEIGAMRRAIAEMPFIKGFTTNPTLMRKAGITDYAAFAREAIAVVGDLPISFEVFSDDFDQMDRQARVIRGWGGATYVKIPVTNTRSESAAPLIQTLSGDGIALNVTALTTLEQVERVRDALAPGVPAIISVFAGRIADTGIDPVPLMAQAKRLLADRPDVELLWASPRELLNLFQADSVGCDILTATPDVLAKLPLVGKDLADYSLDTVTMFYNDAKAAGFSL
jgi:transaldolase